VSPSRRDQLVVLIREVLRAGTLAGLAMIPFAAVFRARGLRINEYGARTLELLVGPVAEPLHTVLTLVQHMIISWVVSVPLLLLLSSFPTRSARIAFGLVYGAAFYVAMNSLALPFAFGDPTPWQLGFETVYPSLVVHLVYGGVLAWFARPVAPAPLLGARGAARAG
jgi:hypothetical protein